MPIELRSTIECVDPELEVRQRVDRFLSSRGFLPTPDPTEYKRGSLLGSLTGLTPKKWAATVGLSAVASDLYEIQFLIDTTGQSVTQSERDFWEREQAALEDAIQGRESHSMGAADEEIASHTRDIIKTICMYSLTGALIVAAVTVALHLAGVPTFAGTPGIGAGFGAALGVRKALASS